MKFFGNRRILVTAFLIIVAMIGIYLATGKTIRVVVDGESREFYTHAITTGAALRYAGIPVSGQDNVVPGLGRILLKDEVITLNHARQVTLFNPETGERHTFISAEKIPVKIAAQIGMDLNSSDRILWNSVELPFDRPLPLAPSYVLQVVKARSIELIENGQSNRINTAGPTAGIALWQAGIVLSESDKLSAPLESPLPENSTLDLVRSIPILIKTGGNEISSRSSAGTVGQALVEAGISLQGLDYSVPAEDQPLPVDGILQVIRVNEQVNLEQTAIPYESDYVENPDVELDQRSVVEAGQYGIEVTRVRVKFEDGQEVSRQDDSQWTAVEPKAEKIGYGTKIVIHTLDTPAGPIEYWRAVPVYATSYSPCRSGTTKCYYGTSSGLPVKRGVIGVTRQWYNLLANQPVYVPGYGTAVIADVGGGAPGKYWIDLGFTDEEFEPWHQNTTLYFLTPVPASIPWILP